LDKDRQKLLKKLLPQIEGFVLGGGTALALQLAHRISYDFDFFSPSPIKKSLLEKLSQVLEINNISTDTADELTFFSKEGIKVTFLYYPFKKAFQLEEFQENLQIFSIKDIAIQKAYTIGRRGEYRDYFDLYTIIKGGYIDLAEIISKAKKVYNHVFEEKMFLQQLVYFDDLLSYQIAPAQKPIPTPDEVKAFFEKQVKDYV
jgi:predicted nucleotidyltransferase component of viral defense system